MERVKGKKKESLLRKPEVEVTPAAILDANAATTIRKEKPKSAN
jgi:hypothetical protein